MTEALNVPEESLLDVCKVIRVGLRALERSNRPVSVKPIPREVRRNLLEWCAEMEHYMAGLQEG